VGTELLLGDILNTNARFLSRELAELGFTLHRQAVVGDNPERLRGDFLAAWERTDFVILTGGLGPTADDITRETVCGALGLELEERAELLEPMREFFRTRGCGMPETNRRQAFVPKGAIQFKLCRDERFAQNHPVSCGDTPPKEGNDVLISEFPSLGGVAAKPTGRSDEAKLPKAENSAFIFSNPNGTAPGIAILKGGKCAILLPGPPGEMEAMFRQSVRPFLAPWTEGTVLSHEIRTMGLGESAMAENAAELLEGENPSVAPYAKPGEALLRVTARAEDKAAAEALMAPVLEEIRRRLGGFIYGVDVPNIETVLIERLTALGKTLSAAESITGGGLAKRLTDCAGASAVLRGSVVAYCDEAKRELLGVSAKTLEEHTAVSGETAMEMARGARKLFGTDFALATTGYADGENQLHAFVALDGEAGTKTQRTAFARSDRRYNRLSAENTAFHMLWQELQNPPIINY